MLRPALRCQQEAMPPAVRSGHLRRCRLTALITAYCPAPSLLLQDLFMSMFFGPRGFASGGFSFYSGHRPRHR